MKQVINPGDVEDVYYAVMKTADDTILVSEFNIGAGSMPNWVIQGDRGTIYVKNDDIEIHRAVFPEQLDAAEYRNAVEITATSEKISGDRYGETDVIYTHIADAVLNNAEYSVSTASALELTRVLDAVRQSDATGQIVYL